MTGTLLLMGKVVFAAVGCAAGVRLAQMARREGGLPLHAWVSAMIFVGSLGLVLFALGPSLAAHSSDLARGAMLLGDGLERLALLALGVFVWRVFGRGSSWRLLALAVVGTSLLLDWAHTLRSEQWPAAGLRGFDEAAGQLAFATPFLWSAAETFVQWRRSGRQLALGIGDASVADRYRLWSLGCACFAAICLLAALAAFLPVGSAAAAGIELLRGALYVTIAGLVSIGLFPTESYLRRVRNEG